jgi:hypothetical protein
LRCVVILKCLPFVKKKESGRAISWKSKASVIVQPRGIGTRASPLEPNARVFLAHPRERLKTQLRHRPDPHDLISAAGCGQFPIRRNRDHAHLFCVSREAPENSGSGGGGGSRVTPLPQGAVVWVFFLLAGTHSSCRAQWIRLPRPMPPLRKVDHFAAQAPYRRRASRSSHLGRRRR